jgi:20S proteasome alpha/beta subunit
MILPKKLTPTAPQMNRVLSRHRLDALKKERRSRKMTIAAGFVYDDGLVFCVDTKITTTIKTNESKLLWNQYGDNKCATVFAVSADDLKFAKSAVGFCVEAIGKNNFNDPTLNIESIRKTIQSALAKFYKDHVFPAQGIGGTDFAFLVGIWLNNETRLFSSHQTVLSSVFEYDCLGTGSYLATYLIRQYLRANPGTMTLEDAALIATYAVDAVNDYDESCDGEPEFLIVRNNGDCSNAYDTAAYPDERLANGIQRETWKLMHSLARIKGEAKRDMQGESGRLLEDFFAEVRALNDSYRHVFEWKSKIAPSESEG